MPADLDSVQEAFLSSSVRLLMPVRQINEDLLPACSGPITRLSLAGITDLNE